MKTNEVICIHAGEHKYCKHCYHARRHEKESICKWSECRIGNDKVIKVRCVKVKEEA